MCLQSYYVLICKSITIVMYIIENNKELYYH